ncbi:hydroxyacylglutathione hydrolase [Desulfocucumis palustris]|uniref:Hydroxyacylglutathione hydrolase n=1 Tax=Desulfocucumis palustris TaxID=1898651 RepID=A0A2L2XFK8_9FIRM|nr:MBL fold metallo-hydrolase [Desulfocucumis palustris]GBF34804.1 hydroxyacylglutathione hydrolase [Desulfocucumis palustris]
MNNKYDLHQINTFHFGWSNYSYIVFDNMTRSAMVVDPAWDLKKITDILNHLNADLVAIFLTHSHYDHTNLVDPLIKMFNPAVYMSRKEIDYYKYWCSNLIALDDEEKISVGRIDVFCLLTPGHTAGGMSYLLPYSMFTGDTIFAEGCGICNCNGSSAAQMFESIQKIKSQVPDHVRIYPGHSYGKIPGQSMGNLKKENFYFNIDKKDYFINFRMRGNQKSLFNFR